MPVPTEPVPTRWQLPDPADAQSGEDLIGVGADLEPGTLLAAYRAGVFPMGVSWRGPLGWWSPDPRAVLPLSGLRVSRSLRRSARTLRVTVDTCFAEVVARCAAPGRPGRWITPRIARAYDHLHGLGWAHSVEVWAGDGSLAGGLYGVEVGGLFAGESMFHAATDGSKVALLALVERLGDDGQAGADRLLDVQWSTPHLASLGAVEVARRDYLRLLARALPLPPVLSTG